MRVPPAIVDELVKVALDVPHTDDGPAAEEKFLREQFTKILEQPMKLAPNSSAVLAYAKGNPALQFSAQSVAKALAMTHPRAAQALCYLQRRGQLKRVGFGSYTVAP